jgi:hypothetical protein
MCCRQLGAAAASILSQNLELQEFFLERSKETEIENDNERRTESVKDKERDRQGERKRV